MRKLSLISGLLFVLIVLFNTNANASYITIPGVGATSSYGSACTYNNGNGTVTPNTTCLLFYAITIPAGSTLSSVTVYYYDTSGSQYMAGALIRSSLTSYGSTSTLASFNDTSTSASVQSSTLSYGSATSSSYTYYVYLLFQSGTILQGIKVSYS